MTEDGGEKDDSANADSSKEEAPKGEAPADDEPEKKPAPSQTLDDAARAQAVARKLAGATGRRGALGRLPSSEGSAQPALAAHPTTGSGAKTQPATPSTPKPATVATPPKTSSPPASNVPSMGRRPLVAPSQRKQKEKSPPFYAGLRIPAKPLIAVAALAILVVGGWFGWKSIDHSRHADEYAVRDELFLYKFDQKEEHFANLDAMGAKAVDFAIGFLTDARPVETSFGKSTTTTAELAHMYLIHYAQRVGVDPPPKALDVVKLGGVRMKPADWTELKDLWTKWFADVQAKGKAK